MESLEYVVNSCRVCRSANQDGDFVNLFAGEQRDELTAAGKLYEELLGEQIDLATMTYYPQFLCNSCDLQMRLFKKLIAKAQRTLEQLHAHYAIELKQEEEIQNDTVRECNVHLEQQQNELTFNKDDTLDQQYSEAEEEKLIEICMDTEQLPKELNVSDECLQAAMHDDNDELSLSNESANSAAQTQYTEIYDDCCSVDATTSLNSDYMEVHYLEDVLEQTRIQTTRKMSPQAQNDNAPSKRKYNCTLCELVFPRRIEYMKHKKSIHGSKYPCPECAKQLNTADALRVHLRLHRGLPAYKCDLCQKTFNQKVHYKYHMDKHNNVRNFKCEQCGKAFLSKADLSIHMRSHTGERPYTCEICGKDYQLMQHLKMHSYSHLGKSFECEICKQKFISPSTLRTHMRSIHTDEPQFQCEFCVKRFRRKHHLNAHYKVHQKQLMNDDNYAADIDNENTNDVTTNVVHAIVDEVFDIVKAEENGIIVLENSDRDATTQFESDDIVDDDDAAVSYLQ